MSTMAKLMSPVEEPFPAAHELNVTQHIRLLKRLRRLSRLRQEVVDAEIPKREKSRAVVFSRNKVRDYDNKFMRELRILVGQGRLQGFEELMKLASQLQDARDSLGPIEQESIDLDQEWEWQVTELAEAEQDIYEEFYEDFQEAAGLPSGSLSSCSSDYQPSPEFANSYLGDEFENPKEDPRYGELPTGESIAHECITPPLLEAMSVQQAGQLDISSDDQAFTSPLISPYDQALEGSMFDSRKSTHQEGETKAFSSSTGEETDFHGSEISASEELHYVPEDSITGDSLTAMQRITVWMIQTSIFSRWDAYLIKWRFMFEDKKLVPTWVVLDIILSQSNNLPKRGDGWSAADISLSLPGATSSMTRDFSCDFFTPPASATEVEIQPKTLPRLDLAKLSEEEETSEIFERASQDTARVSTIGIDNSYNSATEKISHVPVNHAEITSASSITKTTDTSIDRVSIQPQNIHISNGIQESSNSQKIREKPDTLHSDTKQDAAIMKGTGGEDQIALQSPMAFFNHELRSESVAKPRLRSAFNQEVIVFSSGIESPGPIDNAQVSSPVARQGSLPVNSITLPQQTRRASYPSPPHKAAQKFRHIMLSPFRMRLLKPLHYPSISKSRSTKA